MKKEHKNKIKLITKNSFYDFIKIIPIFFIAVIVSVIAENNIPDGVIHGILGKNIMLSTFIATLAGILLPFPQYSSYPFAAFLYNSGAYISAIFAFIAGEVFIGNILEDYLEIKYFSFRFWIMRFIVSVVLIFMGGIIIQYIL